MQYTWSPGHLVPTTQATFNLSFPAAGSKDVKSAELPFNNLLEQTQQLISFCAFIQSINNDVCILELLEGIQECCKKSLVSWPPSAILILGIECLQSFESALTPICELSDQRAVPSTADSCLTAS
jgi:hypothetical protein